MIKPELVVKELRNRLGDLYFTGSIEVCKHMLEVKCSGMGLTTEEKIDAGMLILDMIKEYKVQCLLFDASDYLNGWEGIYNWLEEVWVLSINSLGLKKNAIVMSSNLFGQISAEKTISMNGMQSDQLESRLFVCSEEAVKWLTSGSCCE
ncbi:hypothetical protein V6R21_03680 [Limibacter armeniacum]|uniref:hypothetical protein n=1 Tax=Limibacter armeniacum TaxID=466084 RepID=UPI002FE69549